MSARDNHVEYANKKAAIMGGFFIEGSSGGRIACDSEIEFRVHQIFGRKHFIKFFFIEEFSLQDNIIDGVAGFEGFFGD